MASWRQDYLLALQARDKEEHAQKTIYQAYRTSITSLPLNQKDQITIEAQKAPPKSLKAVALPVSAQASLESEALARLRQDLSEAQRSRRLNQARLDVVSNDLQKVKLKAAEERKRLDDLLSEKAGLALRLRDRDEELRAKAKLLEVRISPSDCESITKVPQAVHDETVSLTLQLNMAENQSEKLKKENEDLVQRWMARMGQEADAMNAASKFT
ncbi:MAG: hypothetical protein Q9222_002177 [Ikaeria aurantiellina]